MKKGNLVNGHNLKNSAIVRCPNHWDPPTISRPIDPAWGLCSTEFIEEKCSQSFWTIATVRFRFTQFHTNRIVDLCQRWLNFRRYYNFCSGFKNWMKSLSISCKGQTKHYDFFKTTNLPKNEQTNSTLLFSFFFWKKSKIPKNILKLIDM